MPETKNLTNDSVMSHQLADSLLPFADLAGEVQSLRRDFTALDSIVNGLPVQRRTADSNAGGDSNPIDFDRRDGSPGEAAGLLGDVMSAVPLVPVQLIGAALSIGAEAMDRADQEAAAMRELYVKTAFILQDRLATVDKRLAQDRETRERLVDGEGNATEGNSQQLAALDQQIGFREQLLASIKSEAEKYTIEGARKLIEEEILKTFISEEELRKRYSEASTTLEAAGDAGEFGLRQELQETFEGGDLDAIHSQLQEMFALRQRLGDEWATDERAKEFARFMPLVDLWNATGSLQLKLDPDSPGEFGKYKPSGLLEEGVDLSNRDYAKWQPVALASDGYYLDDENRPQAVVPVDLDGRTDGETGDAMTAAEMSNIVLRGGSLPESVRPDAEAPVADASPGFGENFVDGLAALGSTPPMANPMMPVAVDPLGAAQSGARAGLELRDFVLGGGLQQTFSDWITSPGPVGLGDLEGRDQPYFNIWPGMLPGENAPGAGIDQTGEDAEISAFASAPLIAGMADQVKGWMELETLLPQLPAPGSLPPEAGVLVFPSETSMLTAGSGILGAEHDVYVDINLKDPGELVKSTFSRVELKTDVAGDLNLGMNMDFNEGD